MPFERNVPHSNFLTVAHLAPFYLREHSKRILRGALFNDSKFLADINVMDYSLVVGVDSVKNELVVGIVGACSFYLGFTSMIHGLTCGFFFRKTSSGHIRGTRN